MPTRANVLRGIDWLVKGAAPGDALFFHFSGHATAVAADDDTGDGGARRGAGACDHARLGSCGGALHERLVRPLPRGVRLTCVIDTGAAPCGLDLPLVLASPTAGWATDDGAAAAADVRLLSTASSAPPAADGAGENANPRRRRGRRRRRRRRRWRLRCAPRVTPPSPPPPSAARLSRVDQRGPEHGGRALRCAVAAAHAFDVAAPFAPAGAADVAAAGAAGRPAGQPRRRRAPRTRREGRGRRDAGAAAALLCRPAARQVARPGGRRRRPAWRGGHAAGSGAVAAAARRVAAAPPSRRPTWRPLPQSCRAGQRRRQGGAPADVWRL